MTDIRVRGLICRIEGCVFAIIEAPRNWLPLSPRAVLEQYGKFWAHCVEQHGLNPDTSEMPGIQEAAFDVLLEEWGDGDGGGDQSVLHIEMRAK